MKRATAFQLGDVRILEGPFAVAHDACAAYLLKVDPDRLLHFFRVHSHLPAKAPAYGGWEDAGLAGHSLGHYLSACSIQFASTGDRRFAEKIRMIVSQLAECQVSRPDGYLGAMPNGDRAWAEVKKGDIRSAGFDLNGLWSPWYTHHKVLQGLIDSFCLGLCDEARPVAERFAAWMLDETAGLSEEQWQHMLGCEYGGMNDALCQLYEISGDAAHLALARKFYDRRVLDPLANGVDDLAGKHANTQIPKIIGLAQLHSVTGEERDAKIAEFFWQRVVHHHSYVIGGNSNHEYFGPADRLSDSLSTNTCESCNSYNMLKLSRALFEKDPRPEYAEFYERAHFNHILASQDPASAMMTYFMPLSSGAAREYSDPYDNWTCCHGSGMETHSKHHDSIYFQDGGERLWVNQYISSEVRWRQAGLVIEQHTSIPAEGTVSLTVREGGPHDCTLMLRHPKWAKGPVEIRVNGNVALRSNQPQSYAELSRTWRAGDRVEFTLPMEPYTDAMPDNPKRIALLCGPVVLSADLGPDHGAAPRTPVLVTGDRPPEDWLHLVSHHPVEFATQGVGRPADLSFRPFFELHHARYATYFDVFSEAEWSAAEAAWLAAEAHRRDLEARTVDFARIGEMQPERDHHLRSEYCDVRGANGRGFRTPLEGGWFELTLKVHPAAPMDLVMTYWGNERVKPEFDLLVDGEHLATETAPHDRPNEFFDEVHSLPEDVTKGKLSITLRVAAIPGKRAGSVSGARTVRRQGSSS